MDDDFVHDILGSPVTAPNGRGRRDNDSISSNMISLRTLNGSSPRDRDSPNSTRRSFGNSNSNVKFSPASTTLNKTSGSTNFTTSHSLNRDETVGSPKSGQYTALEGGGSHGASGINKDEGEKELHAQSLFRYALVFINFTFIVASLLMMMAGVVARENSAFKLCERCGDLTMVSIIFGAILWLFAMFGFNWIRQRNILLLLVYVGFLLALFLVLLASIITGAVFDAEVESRLNSATRDQTFLKQWEKGVVVNDSSLCLLQQRFNCSGFYFGCCRGYNDSLGADNSEACFGSASNKTLPSWYSLVCPYCNEEKFPPPSTQVCTKKVYGALRKNLGGFIVANCFSFFLVSTGIALSALARKINRRETNGD